MKTCGHRFHCHVLGHFIASPVPTSAFTDRIIGNQWVIMKLSFNSGERSFPGLCSVRFSDNHSPVGPPCPCRNVGLGYTGGALQGGRPCQVEFYGLRIGCGGMFRQDDPERRAGAIVVVIDLDAAAVGFDDGAAGVARRMSGPATLVVKNGPNKHQWVRTGELWGMPVGNPLHDELVFISHHPACRVPRGWPWPWRHRLPGAWLGAPG